MNIIKELTNIYSDKLSFGEPCVLQQLREMRRSPNVNEQPAYPLLLKINEEALAKADLRIMIFGQETNSWETKVSNSAMLLEESKSIIESTVSAFMDFYKDSHSIKY